MSIIPEGLRRPFRSRNYRLYAIGMIVSQLGMWMHGVASSWLVYRLTGSSVALGLVAFAGQIPLFVLAPFGGVIADAFPRRRIIFFTQILILIATLVLSILTIAGVVAMWHIVALSFVIGCVGAVDSPTRQAFVVEMVGKDDLPNAIAINSSMSNSMRLVGPMVAGVAIPFIGEGGCFLFHCLGYMALVICLLLMDIAPRAVERIHGRVLADIADGFRFAARHPGIRVILLCLAGISLLGAPISALLPVFVAEDLGSAAAALGILTSASGVGALAGALALGSRTRKGILVWTLSAGLLAALGIMVLSRTGSIVPAAACMVFFGAGQVVGIASCNTLLQLSTPDHYRGRIMAMFTMTVMGISPAGSLAAGVLAEACGVPLTYLVCGGLLLLLTAVAAPFLGRHARGIA